MGQLLTSHLQRGGPRVTNAVLGLFYPFSRKIFYLFFENFMHGIFTTVILFPQLPPDPPKTSFFLSFMIFPLSLIIFSFFSLYPFL